MPLIKSPFQDHPHPDHYINNIILKLAHDLRLHIRQEDPISLLSLLPITTPAMLMTASNITASGHTWAHDFQQTILYMSIMSFCEQEHQLLLTNGQ